MPFFAASAAASSVLLTGALGFQAPSSPSGCPGFSGVVPTLELKSGVKQGLTTLGELTGAPSTLSVLLAGLDNAQYAGFSLPLELGMIVPELSGCFLYLAPEVMLPFPLDANGKAKLSFQGWSAGIPVYLQAWNLDLDFANLSQLGGFTEPLDLISEVPTEVYFSGASLTEAYAFQLHSADLNGDGQADFVTTALGTLSGLEIHLSQGTAEYAPPLDVDFPSGFVEIGTADFNDDGNADLFCRGGLSPEQAFVRLGTGTGSFGSVLASPLGFAATDFQFHDFDRDGLTDLVALERNLQQILFARGVGDGTFAAPQFSPIGGDPQSLAIADVDGDGQLDACASTFSPDTVAVLLGQGDGTFLSVGSLSPGSGPGRPVLFDSNGDAILDLIVACRHSNEVVRFPGLGLGGFGVGEVLATIEEAWTLVECDTNLDGVTDLAVGTWQPLFGSNFDAARFEVLLGTGAGDFAAQGQINVSQTIQKMLFEDFNLDGIEDLIVGDTGATVVRMFEGDGAGSFLIPDGIELGPGADWKPLDELVATDLNADGLSDLVYVTPGVPYSPKGLCTALGMGDGQFAAPDCVSIGDFSGTMNIEVGDLDGDGVQDVVLPLRNPPRFEALLGVGDGSFATPLPQPILAHVRSGRLADVDLDGTLDYVVQDDDEDFTIWLGYGDGTFAKGNTTSFGGMFVADFQVADLGQGAFPDLVASVPGAHALRVRYGQGAGAFGPELGFAFLPYSDPGQLLVDDFDGDGNGDVAFAVGGYSLVDSIAITLGDEFGGFSNPTLYPTQDSVRELQKADVNQDGIQDLVLFDLEGNLQVLVGEPSGLFLQARAYYAAPKIDNMAILDLDLDGTPDVIGSIPFEVIAGSGHSIALLRNRLLW